MTGIDEASVLITDAFHKKLLQDWLGYNPGFTVLYSASKHGFSNATFHAKCDGKV